MANRYRVSSKNDALGTIELVDEELHARVTLAAARGGMVTGFTLGDDDILYMDDATLTDLTKNVRGGAPVLFPIAGKVARDTLVIDGESFPLKQHGFARNRAWESRVDASNDEAVAELVLRPGADPIDRALPITVTHRHVLKDGALTIEQTYTQSSGAPLRVQPGFHPYFRVADSAKANARVITDATLAWDNVTGERSAVRGPIDLTQKEVDLHLLDGKSKTVRLVRSGANDVVITTADDYAVTVVWTLAGRDFVCVEPWTLPANALNEGGGVVVLSGVPYRTWIRIARA